MALLERNAADRERTAEREKQLKEETQIESRKTRGHVEDKNILNRKGSLRWEGFAETREKENRKVF